MISKYAKQKKQNQYDRKQRNVAVSRSRYMSKCSESESDEGSSEAEKDVKQNFREPDQPEILIKKPDSSNLDDLIGLLLKKFSESREIQADLQAENQKLRSENQELKQRLDLLLLKINTLQSSRNH